ncbi:MAG TPA: RsmB/NOP family class I SAM-dependent RNA methyltransferase [Streptosporangiaceae bacterium]|nr:RsmB/NOP family class I SAM-dependent RNA methyltransferase [Streptosporangiaceae bacterium]
MSPLERVSAHLALPDGARRTQWSPFGVRLAGGDPAPLIATGHAAAQDEASQLAALALAAAPLSGTDARWLDLCAGPGGKARLLACLAAARDARLVAAELRPHRAARVREALDRIPAPAPDAPASNSPASDGPAANDRAPRVEAQVVVADGRRAPWRPGTFDRVLADVPCSGLGSLRRRPEARWRKSPSDIPELAELQRQLLRSAIDSVRPGGVVAYVTCSPHVAETHDIVTAVTGERSDVTILDAPAILNDGLLDAEIPGLPAPRDKRFAQFWPHRHGTDAIFLALLIRWEDVSPQTPLITRG